MTQTFERHLSGLVAHAQGLTGMLAHTYGSGKGRGQPSFLHNKPDNVAKPDLTQTILV